MSDDLISRKAVLEELESLRVALTGISCRKEYKTTQKEIMNSVIRIIEEHPTAFDKEKVIEKLRSEAQRWHESGVKFKDENEKGVAGGFRLATHIVEKGGIE